MVSCLCCRIQVGPWRRVWDKEVQLWTKPTRSSRLPAGTPTKPVARSSDSPPMSCKPHSGQKPCLCMPPAALDNQDAALNLLRPRCTGTTRHWVDGWAAPCRGFSPDPVTPLSKLNLKKRSSGCMAEHGVRARTDPGSDYPSTAVEADGCDSCSPPSLPSRSEVAPQSHRHLLNNYCHCIIQRCLFTENIVTVDLARTAHPLSDFHVSPISQARRITWRDRPQWMGSVMCSLTEPSRRTPLLFCSGRKTNFRITGYLLW